MPLSGHHIFASFSYIIGAATSTEQGGVRCNGYSPRFQTGFPEGGLPSSGSLLRSMRALKVFLFCPPEIMRPLLVGVLVVWRL